MARGDCAQSATGLDGTWGGAQGSLSAQVIVVGASVVGFFWGEDYLDTRDAALSADGKSLAFDFKGGKATLTRTGERSMRLEVDQGGRVSRLELKRD